MLAKEDSPERKQVKHIGLAINTKLKTHWWNGSNINISAKWKKYTHGLIRI